MPKEILITFHNKGLRSYIEVDLCAQCPRQDDKGCCGFYSPIFYPTDFAYLLTVKPELVEHILSLPDITILDSSVTVNNKIDGDSYKCHFHTNDQGCSLDQSWRESICRHFVCPGINWVEEETMSHWQQFFDQLSEYEINLNNTIADKLKTESLSLRNIETRELYFKQLMVFFREESENPPNFFGKYPEKETLKLHRVLTFGSEWPL
ncbi:MAG TPA: hypothetical protein VFC73_07455 [Syntrophomonadaceae bacterium]|nr:hypothetical protein [Syntrophomonadaceae bacterium]